MESSYSSVHCESRLAAVGNPEKGERLPLKAGTRALVT
jgi:hypothetical protein